MCAYAGRCGGSPGHIIEFCMWLQSRSLVSIETNVADVLPAAAIESAPVSAHHLAAAVVGRLPAAPARLLQSACVFGSYFSTSMVKKIVTAEVASDIESVLDLLEVLRRSDVLTEFDSTDNANIVWQ
eukprot:scaffold71876_cov43-Prasinocladus_malaysianus.AAC.1